MANVTEARNATNAQGRALHDAGVQLADSVGVEARADAGVEQRLVLEVADGCDGGGEGAVPYARPTGVARALDSRQASCALAFRNRSGAAVGDERRAGAQ
jgi:hypothetical protein